MKIHTKKTIKNQIQYCRSLPDIHEAPETTVLFYDSILVKNKNTKSWIKRFPHKIALKSGEDLKTLASFTAVLNKITKLTVPKTTQLSFVALGGGSVGDFVGFLASVYLRGRRLVQIPSTWLSTVDSAHGGKNGLNFLKTKNQVGTFYLADKIYICQDLLMTQPEARLTESMGEIVKTALLRDKKLFEVLESKPNADAIYKLLPRLISHKYAIVNQDPFEKKGIRRLLNLGHTMGHVFESTFGWPHGVAVLMGIQFSARWSFSRGLLNEKDFIRISMLIESLELDQNLNVSLKKLKPIKVRSLLVQDKKLINKSEIDFIFIKKIGHCVRYSMTIDQIANEINRQLSEY